MPAHEYINQQQLRRLRGLDFTEGDGEELTVGEAKPEDWFDMEHYNALKADIAKNGIRRPIKTLYGEYLNEGHHRAMAAKELNLSRIPVVDFDNPMEEGTYDTAEESRWHKK